MKISKIYEILFLIYIAVISLIPLQEISFLGVSYFSIFSSFVVVLAIPLIFFKRDSRSAKIVFFLFISLLVFALISTYFNTYLFSKVLIILPLFYSLLAVVLPYIYSKIVTSSSIDYKKHIFSVALIITISSMIFGLYSYLRSTGVTYRFSSPIGGAAVNHVVLLLTLGVYLANIKESYKTKISYLFLIITMGLIILTGSRAGLITMCLLLFLYFINFKKPVKSFFTFLTISTLLLLSLWVFPTDRYNNFESQARDISYTTSLKISTSSPSNLIFGAGHGVVFPWYAYEYGFLSYDKNSSLVPNEHGYLLTNPHSVFIGIITELGLVGLGLFAFIVLILLKSFVKTIRLDNSYIRVIMLAILCTLPSFALDYYIFKNFVVSTIWWYFVFYSLMLATSTGRR